MTPSQYGLLSPDQKILADLLIDLIRHVKRMADALEKGLE